MQPVQRIAKRLLQMRDDRSNRRTEVTDDQTSTISPEHTQATQELLRAIDAAGLNEEGVNATGLYELCGTSTCNCDADVSDDHA
jgi:ABC-type uncharacterized transport system involved in gliding motility auxiliary subunit